MTAAPEPVRCSVLQIRHNPEGHFYPLEDIRRFVAETDVIVRAVALDASPLETSSKTALNDRRIVFRSIEVLRGALDGTRFVVGGVLVDRDDFNLGAVPYRMVRSSGGRGGCFANEYRPGAEYLLLLRRRGASLTPYWAPLAPMNEQIRVADDPWLLWSRTVPPRFSTSTGKSTVFPPSRMHVTGSSKMTTSLSTRSTTRTCAMLAWRARISSRHQRHRMLISSAECSYADSYRRSPSGLTRHLAASLAPRTPAASILPCP
jgi:hypothetical protein